MWRSRQLRLGAIATNGSMAMSAAAPLYGGGGRVRRYGDDARSMFLRSWDTRISISLRRADRRARFLHLLGRSRVCRVSCWSSAVLSIFPFLAARGRTASVLAAIRFHCNLIPFTAVGSDAVVGLESESSTQLPPPTPRVTRCAGQNGGYRWRGNMLLPVEGVIGLLRA